MLKIAYGIMSMPKKASRKLLEQIGGLGIMGIDSAKEGFLIKKYMEKKPKLLKRFLVYDLYSPWALLAELNSTHPLTGKRIAKLLGLKVPKPNLKQLYAKFLVDAFFYFIPIFLPVALGFTSLLLFNSAKLVVAGLVFGAGTGLLLKTLYAFPFGKASDTSVVELFADLYASPVRGKLIKLKGKVIGRGIPGFFLSEDWMVDDGTGILYIDYKSWLPGIGEIFFALTKVREIEGKRGTFVGWFYRKIGGWLVLKEAEVSGSKIASHPILWHFLLACLLILAGIALMLF